MNAHMDVGVAWLEPQPSQTVELHVSLCRDLGGCYPATQELTQVAG
ncbi:MAG: hypothetical protein AAF800_12500 [Planctomycetota bacterium]